MTLFSILPLYLLSANYGFEKNIGQVVDTDRSTNTDVLYIYHQSNLQITLRKNGFSYELKAQEATDLKKIPLEKDVNSKIESIIERIDFVFPQLPSEIISEGVSESKMRYFNENGEFKTQQYKRILYKGVDNGFDIEFLIVDNKFKYNILKSASGKLKDFYLKVKTSGDLSIVDDMLQISTELGQVNENIPISYIGIDKLLVKINFSLQNENLVFTSETNTDNQVLIIDPVPDLVWSTFIGGEDYDFTSGTVTTEDGFIYTTGITSSLNNISTSGAFQTSHQGDLDIFINKFSENGTLIWATYYGGPSSERIYGIAEENGFIYLGGCTFSSIGVVTTDAQQSSIEGADDIFILKMDAYGNRIWCTYHGGNDHDFITDMLVENDTIFMVGHTRSINNISTSGVHLETYSANEAGHLTLFSTAGNFLWGTYFGSENSNSIQGITRSDNKIFVTGRSNALNGISTANSHQESFAGFKDAFLAKFENDGTLLWSTYFGGDYSDEANAIGPDSTGGVFIAGNTSSLNNIATNGVHQPNRLSSEQGFVANFNAAGELNWATYTGGTDTDYLTSIHVNKNAVYIGGKTLSNDEIVTADTYQPTKGAGYDGFIQAFDYEGNLIWGTYLGGIGNEEVISISLISENLIVSGSVNKDDPIFGHGNSHSSNYSGGTSDGFLAYLCQPLQPTIILSGDSLFASTSEDIDWYLDGNVIASNTGSIMPEVNGSYTVISTQLGKCDSSSDTLNLSTIGVIISKDKLNNGAIVYPNPISDRINIEKQGTFNGIVMTIEGKTIIKFKGENSIQIDMGKFSSGTYIIHLNDTSEHSVLKIVKN